MNDEQKTKAQLINELAELRLKVTTLESADTLRKQAEEKLRASEERYQSFISKSFKGISRTEFTQPVDITLPVETQIDEIYEHAYMAECNLALAQMYALPSVAALVGTRLIDAHGGKDNPINRATFRTFIHNGYRSINDETVEYDAHGQPTALIIPFPARTD